MNPTTHESITDIINRLFVFTDQHDWTGLQSEVFTPDVDFDMTSMGGENKKMTSKVICETWEEGFKDIDVSNHLAGNYLIKVQNDSAFVEAYATATHYKKAAKEGQTRQFVGTYEIRLDRVQDDWRISAFRYSLLFATGNLQLI